MIDVSRMLTDLSSRKMLMMMNKCISLFFLLTLISQVHAASNIIGLNFQQEGDISHLIIRGDGPLVFTKRHNKDQKTLILDIQDVVSSQKTLRPIDTSEFPGAVVYVSAYPKPDSPNDIRVAIQLRDNVNSEVEKVGNSLVLKIENRFGAFAQNSGSSSSLNLSQDGNLPIIEGEENSQQEQLGLKVPKSAQVEDILENITLAGNKKYIGKKISINVKNVPVDDVLQMISETSGFNVFLEDGVSSKPPMTINLLDVPWDEALDTVLMINKLSATKYNNILTITTIEKALEAQAKKVEEDKKLKVQEPLVTKIFSINYAKIADVVTILNDYKTEERGKITTETRTNKLIVKDTATVIDRMKKILELIDTANPQILIESKIVEINESASKELGLDSSSFIYNPFKRFEATDTSPTPGFTFNTLGTGSLVSLSVDVFKRLKDVSLSLKLLENRSMAKIVSSPRIITQNNVAASINSSQSSPYRTQVTSNGVVTEQWNQASASISLSVTPNVTNNGSISLNVNVSKSGFVGQPPPNGPPPQASNTISTNVLVDNGATVVLGGLYKLEDSESHAGIPVLKDIPILGWLFRTKYNPVKSKSEMMVFITPSIMNQTEAGLAQGSEM